MNGRLYRSPTDRVLAGVAGGMAESYGLDPALVRVGWALLILVTGGVFLILYIVMALVVPLRPDGIGVAIFAAAGPPGDPPTPGGASGAGDPSPGSTGQGSRYQPWRQDHPRRDNAGPLVLGMILILVGVFFLVRQFIPQINLGLIWPWVVIVAGALLIIAAFIRREPSR
jgi:phage shock protein PspC (stress-responsive transcriptional regulator)